MTILALHIQGGGEQEPKMLQWNIFLRSRLRTLVALAAEVKTRSCHFKLHPTVTPRYLKVSTQSNKTLLMAYLWKGGEHLLEIQIALHLVRFKFSCHFRDHL